jgi:hypothetical protein
VPPYEFTTAFSEVRVMLFVSSFGVYEEGHEVHACIVAMSQTMCFDHVETRTRKSRSEPLIQILSVEQIDWPVLWLVADVVGVL